MSQQKFFKSYLIDEKRQSIGWRQNRKKLETSTEYQHFFWKRAKLNYDIHVLVSICHAFSSTLVTI